MRFGRWSRRPPPEEFWEVLTDFGKILRQRRGNVGICKLQKLEIVGWNRLPNGRLPRPQALSQLRELVDKLVIVKQSKIW